MLEYIIHPKRKFLYRACLLISIVFTAVGCNHLFLQPTKIRYPFATEQNISRLEFQIRARDGVQLSAWRFPAKPTSAQLGIQTPKALIVQFHGNGENLTSHFLSVQWLTEFGFEVVSFDYRGYGASTGQRDLRGTYHDAQDVLAEFNQEATSRNLPLIAIGQSLGGTLLLRALQDNPTATTALRVCVIDSSFYSFRSIANDKLNMSTLTMPLQLLTPLLVTDRYSPGGENMQTLPRKISYLFFHSIQDPVVPYQQGTRLFSEVPVDQDRKTFFPIDQRGHVIAFAKNGAFSKRMKVVHELERILAQPQAP